MTASVPIQRLQGLAVLAGAVLLTGLLAWGAAAPILDVRESVSDAKARVERFNAAARSTNVSNIDTSLVISTGETVEARSLAIQRALVDDTSAVGLQMRQLSATPPRDMERGLVRLSYEIDAAGDLEHWTSFMRTLSDRRPALFIDKVVLRAGPGPRPDLNLSMQFAVTAYVLRQTAVAQ